MDNENQPQNEPQVAPVASDPASSRPIPPLDDFIAYCKANPSERFWQALRNWAGQDFILSGNLSNRKGGKEFATIDGIKVYVHDTYHFTGKDS